MKESHASWVDDVEVPQEFVNLSDDKQEFLHRYGDKKKTALNTKLSQSIGPSKPKRRRRARPRLSQAPQMNSSVPIFDPSVPPSNYGHPYMISHHQPDPGVQTLPDYPVAPGTEAANYSSLFIYYPLNSSMYNFIQTNQPCPGGQTMSNYPVAPETAANWSSSYTHYPKNSFLYNFAQTNQPGPGGQTMPDYPVAPGTAGENCKTEESYFQSSSMDNFDPNFGQTNF